MAGNESSWLDLAETLIHPVFEFRCLAGCFAVCVITSGFRLRGAKVAQLPSFV
jgi:hypothetical protein